MAPLEDEDSDGDVFNNSGRAAQVEGQADPPGCKTKRQSFSLRSALKLPAPSWDAMGKEVDSSDDEIDFGKGPATAEQQRYLPSQGLGAMPAPSANAHMRQTRKRAPERSEPDVVEVDAQTGPAAQRLGASAGRSALEREAIDIFKGIDIDNSDALSLKEWMSAFRAIDSNSDKCISRKEWINVHGSTEVFDRITKKATGNLTVAEWQKSFMEIDTNDDGEISFQEWLQYHSQAARSAQVRPQQRLQEDFRQPALQLSAGLAGQQQTMVCAHCGFTYEYVVERFCGRCGEPRGSTNSSAAISATGRRPA